MKWRSFRVWFRIFGTLVLLYLLTAYFVLPRLWYDREHQHGLQATPAITTTPQGIPGDPLNVGLVGDLKDVVGAMHKAGWHPADPITLKSSLEMAGSVMLDRPYEDAPVSTLLYEGRPQDLAFEKSIGGSADRRNHVRFWKVLDKGVEGRPVWLGSATLDRGIGLSGYTGQITHHIAPDIDDERNFLIADLSRASIVAKIYQLTGVGPTVAGRNGEGDWYHTDGEIKVAVISPGAVAVPAVPETDAASPFMQMKDGVWAVVSNLITPADPPN